VVVQEVSTVDVTQLWLDDRHGIWNAITYKLPRKPKSSAVSDCSEAFTHSMLASSGHLHAILVTFFIAAGSKNEA